MNMHIKNNAVSSSQLI